MDIYASDQLLSGGRHCSAKVDSDRRDLSATVGSATAMPKTSRNTEPVRTTPRVSTKSLDEIGGPVGPKSNFSRGMPGDFRKQKKDQISHWNEWKTWVHGRASENHDFEDGR